jgi:hypothetical protein
MNEMSMQTRRTQGLVTTCLVTLMASVGLGQPAQSSVSLGALAVRGPLGRPAIQQVLESSLAAYQACVAQRAGERLAGELSVRVHIEANGVPIAASVDRSNVGDRALERCVAAATEAWRLAERNAATVVTFTLRVGRGAPSGQERDVGQVISLGDSDDGHLPESARNSQPGGGRPLVLRRTWAPVPGGMHVVGGPQRGSRGPSAAGAHQPAAALRLGGARGHGRACARGRCWCPCASGPAARSTKSPWCR